MDQPQLRRGGDLSRPVRYNPVPIGGPDRPPVTQTPSPGTICAASPRDRESYPDRSLRRALETSAIKREAGLRDDSDYPPEPPSAVTDYTDRSSTAHPDACRDSSRDGDDVDGEPQKKKQKRNKPTLSCYECVERKTKVGLFFVSLCGKFALWRVWVHFLSPICPCSILYSRELMFS